MKIAPRLAAGAVLATSCLHVFAALPTVATPTPVPASTPGLLQAALGMLLVLGLIFGLAGLARRFGLQRLGGSSVIKVVASSPVGTRERVVIVDVAGTWLVLGVTAAQVNTLHTLPAQSNAPTLNRTADEPGLLGLFSSKLSAALSGGRSAA